MLKLVDKKCQFLFSEGSTFQHLFIYFSTLHQRKEGRIKNWCFFQFIVKGTSYKLEAFIQRIGVNLTKLFLLKVAAEVAAPLSQAKKLTMVSSGNSEVGAAKLTGEVMEIITRVPGMVKNMTGVDVTKVNACFFYYIFSYICWLCDGLWLLYVCVLVIILI